MHDTALLCGEMLNQAYGFRGMKVIDVGGRNVNGSLRSVFETTGCQFTSIDMEEDPSVDLVVKPEEPLPLENSSIDMCVSSSCFEHDPCFWETFADLARVTKLGGYIYVNVPSNGPYHMYPGDNWRFYYDAGQALALWATRQKWPVQLVECFFVAPLKDMWTDYVCVWKRCDMSETVPGILVSDTIVQKLGPLEKHLIEKNCTITKRPKTLS